MYVNDDKPRAVLRTLLHEATLICDQMGARGYSTADIVAFCRVYAGARLGLARPPSPVVPDWRDITWTEFTEGGNCD